MSHVLAMPGCDDYTSAHSLYADSFVKHNSPLRRRIQRGSRSSPTVQLSAIDRTPNSHNKTEASLYHDSYVAPLSPPAAPPPRGTHSKQEQVAPWDSFAKVPQDAHCSVYRSTFRCGGNVESRSSLKDKFKRMNEESLPTVRCPFLATTTSRAAYTPIPSDFRRARPAHSEVAVAKTDFALGCTTTNRGELSDPRRSADPLMSLQPAGRKLNSNGTVQFGDPVHRPTGSTLAQDSYRPFVFSRATLK